MTYASEKRRLDRQHAARQAQERIEPLREQIERQGPKAWAWRLRDRELAGEHLNDRLKAEWRAALERELLAMPKEERT